MTYQRLALSPSASTYPELGTDAKERKGHKWSMAELDHSSPPSPQPAGRPAGHLGLCFEDFMLLLGLSCQPRKAEPQLPTRTSGVEL